MGSPKPRNFRQIIPVLFDIEMRDFYTAVFIQDGLILEERNGYLDSLVFVESHLRVELFTKIIISHDLSR